VFENHGRPLIFQRHFPGGLTVRLRYQSATPSRVRVHVPLAEPGEVTQEGARRGLLSSTMPGFGLGQAEMSIASIPDDPRQPG